MDKGGKKVHQIKRTGLVLVLVIVWSLFGFCMSAAAESQYLDPPPSEGGIYFTIELPNVDSSVKASMAGPYNVLQWKEFFISATFRGKDENGKAIVIPDLGGTWTSSDESVLRSRGAGNFYTVKKSNNPVTVTFSCTLDGKPYTGTVQFSVNSLTPVGSNADVLRYAALSQLAYADKLWEHKGETVENLLKPKLSDGVGFEERNNAFNADDPLLASGEYVDKAATNRDFIAACAGDCTIVDQWNIGAFSGTVFSHNGTTIIAYRGTSGIWDDGYSDVHLGLGWVEKDQFISALLMRRHFYGGNVVLTGHSLGGGLANYVSVLTNTPAYTFNAPSTMVTAVSNYYSGVEPYTLGKSFSGLNDGLRVDHVNHLDWVGKVGAGDSGLFTDRNPNGQIDPTVFHAEETLIAKGFPANHPITRMTHYDPEKNTLSMTSENGVTHPAFHYFSWNSASYVFGSSGEDTVEPKHFKMIDKTAFVLTGDGNDNITTSASTNTRIIAGKGEDTIVHNGYFGGACRCDFYQGHGTDTIYVNGGHLIFRVYDYKDIEVEADGLTVEVRSQPDQQLLAKITRTGNSKLSIYLGDKLHKEYGPMRVATRAYQAHGPVNVEIYDGMGQLVETVLAGVVSSGSGDYGYYHSSKGDNGYTKSVILTGEGYKLRIVGVGEGTMEYECGFDDGQGRTGWHLRDIPVHAGSVFYPYGSYEEGVLLGDLDGDGVMDYEPHYDPTQSIILPAEQQLALGRTAQLTAEVLPVTAEPYLTWSSSNPEIVSVDEQGRLTAYGFGTAEISATADDGSNLSAVCTVTVPEETLSIADAVVRGVNREYQYTGMPFRPELTVTYRDITLIENVHYLVEYSDNAFPGDAEIVITGINAFTGTVSIPYTITYNVAQAVSDRVNSIYAACIDSGANGEYEIALWLHDWLTHNANYDYSYTEYQPDGVLLKGTGVCQSYALAYQLLLNRAGIQNTVISSNQMDHAWNLVQIDGEWCHVDCTWDDPGTGGAECYTYFGMNDSLMSRDHIWDQSAYIASSSLKNYYLLRSGSPVATTAEEALACMDEQALAKKSPVECWYIGEDADFSLLDVFESWFGKNNWKYGLKSYTLSYTQYGLSAQIEYIEPWDKPNTLTEPVACPSFVLEGPEGAYRLSNYSHNGLVLIFGREGCMNTSGLLDRMQSELPKLTSGGIEVLINVEGAENPADLAAMMEAYPDFHYTYGDMRLLSDVTEAVGCSGWITYPLVAVINSEGMITFYSMGYVDDVDVLVGEVFSVATNNGLPQPECPDYSNKIEVDLSSVGESSVKDYLLERSRNTNGVIFLYDYQLNGSSLEMLEKWEANSAVYGALNIELVACIVTLSQSDIASYSSAYPHVHFIENDDSVFWNMLRAVGYSGSTAYYRSNYLIDGSGRIIDYTNGTTMNLSKSVIRLTNAMPYDICPPSAIQELEAQAFAGAAISSVDFSGTAITVIGDACFQNCNKLTRVRIPNTVHSIADNAFDGCSYPIFICEYGSYAYNYAQARGISCLTY